MQICINETPQVIISSKLMGLCMKYSWSIVTLAVVIFGDSNWKCFEYCCVLNNEIHHMAFSYVYLQFKNEFKDNYLASTSLYVL